MHLTGREFEHANFAGINLVARCRVIGYLNKCRDLVAYERRARIFLCQGEMMLRMPFRRYLFVVVSGALAATAGYAQTVDVQADQRPDPTAGERVGDQLEEIIVTAQKRSQLLNEVPMSITALNSQRLDERGFRDTGDLARMVPGFSFVNTGVNAPVYSIRGVGFYEVSLASSPAVAVYVDEVGLPYPAMTVGASLDLERVEVLKGPQGTLFGQNSTGGLVNYVTRKPTKHFESGVKATFARFNEVDFEGYVSGPLSDSVAARLAVRTVQGDEWQQNIHGNDQNGAVDRTSARMLLDWNPTESVSVAFNLNGWVNKSDTIAPRLIAITPNNAARLLPQIRDSTLVTGTDPREAGWNPGQELYRDDDFWQSALRVGWTVNDALTLTSITAYTSYRTDAYNERDGTAYENSEYPTVGSIDSFNQEFRLSGEVDQLVTWVAGANYFDDETSDQQLIRYSTASNVQSVAGYKFTVGNTRAAQEIESYAVFASADWMLSESLTLTTGARYTDETRNLTNACSYSTDPNQLAAFASISATNRARAGLPPAPFVPVEDCITLNSVYLPDVVRKELTEDNVSWRVALGWQPMNEVLLYSYVANGYKSGSFPTQGSSSDLQYLPAVQENLLAYEIGGKATVLDRTMQLNAAAFYYDYQDKQTRGRLIDPIFGSLQKLVNIPKSNAQGFEFDVNWLPVDGLNLYLGVAYTDSEIENYVSYSQLGALFDFSGQPFSYSPEWQGVSDVSYQWTVSEGLLMTVGAALVYKGETTADSNSNVLFDIDEYSQYDARIKLEDANGKWNVELWGRNLTDEYYWTNVFKATDTTVQVPGNPRTYGVTLGYTFR